MVRKEGWDSTVPAYSLQDIIDMLPLSICVNGMEGTLNVGKKGISYIHYGSLHCLHNESDRKNLIDAAYKMLCWCIGNGHKKANKEGQK